MKIHRRPLPRRRLRAQGRAAYTRTIAFFSPAPRRLITIKRLRGSECVLLHASPAQDPRLSLRWRALQ